MFYLSPTPAIRL